MAWQVHCKYCYHVFTVTLESVSLDQDAADATLTVKCPICNHIDEYAAGDVGNCDLAQAS